MTLRSLPILFLILALPFVAGLEITESIEYQDSENAIIRLEMLQIGNDTLVLGWNLPSFRVERVDGNATLSVTKEGEMTKMLFEISGEDGVSLHIATALPIEPGRRRSFPVPFCLSQPSEAISLSVLLPRGWTSQASAPESSRLLDRGTGRIQLGWTGVTESVSVVPVMPGLGEDQMREIMFRLTLAAYLPLALALIVPIVALALYAGFTRRRRAIGRSAKSAETLLFEGGRGGDGTRLEEDQPPPHRNRQP